MGSKAHVREVGAVSIVDFSGYLMLGEPSAVLREAIFDLADKQRNKIILNFRGVTTVDSAGIGELVAAYAAVRKGEGRLKLLSPPQKIIDMLTITQLSRILAIHTDEESALRSFG